MDNINLQKIYLVVEITDYECFYESFPENRVQPSWDYYPFKGVIKIDLGTEIIDYLNSQEIFELCFEDFLDLKVENEYLSTIDPDFFKKFGRLYIYIDYYLKGSDYTNVYKNCDTILSTDFLYKNSKLLNFVKCFVFYIEDKKLYVNKLTDYLKRFLNNDHEINVDLLLLNFDDLDTPLNNCVIKMVDRYRNAKYYKVNEIII
jgi:hypothetical protein